MDHNYHYAGLSYAKNLPGVSFHSFELFEGDRQIGTIVLHVHSTDAPLIKKQIATAHRDFAGLLRRWADQAEGQAVSFDNR